MPTVALLNQAGKKVKDLTLSSEIFGIEPNQQVIYDVVNAQRAAMRQGTHDTKTRTEVRGGGRKPWAQKGTGRARQGSIRAPQWRGGGIVFGPTPRDYSVKVNRKVKKLALKSALSYKVLNNKLVAVEAIALEQVKTKDFLQVIENLKLTGKKVLFVLPEVTENVEKSSRNIPNVSVNVQNHVSVFDILKYDQVVLAVDSVKYFEEVLN
ncbi:MAG: 50S ribosomal protein L4 [bacterium]